MLGELNKGALFSIILIFFICFFLLVGCDSRSRYKVLTVVFTGVPPYEEYIKGDNEKKDPSQIEHAQRKEYAHPLWQSGACDSCHTSVLQEDITDLGVKRTVDLDFGVNSLEAPPLVRPPEKLCIHCHLDKTPRRAIRERIWLHNPVARGRCLDCHAPHKSYNLAHLKTNWRVICTTCHIDIEENLPAPCLGQKPDKETSQINCLVCHNPHMGKDRYMLRKDSREKKFTVQ